VSLWILRRCRKSSGTAASSSCRGTLLAQNVDQSELAGSGGSNSSGSRNSFRCFDQSCITPTENCRLSPYCESTSVEPGAGNLHAGFCGSRRRLTASGHPVGGQQPIKKGRAAMQCAPSIGYFQSFPRFRYFVAMRCGSIFRARGSPRSQLRFLRAIPSPKGIMAVPRGE
jgi:hypothetical protein